jgi:DNA-binding NtrC family response regulator
MLFGSKKGAFTGAHTNLSGYFRDADHGTLFLDELAELDSTVQAMLLRVIEEGKVMPLGGIEERTHQVKQKNAPEQFRQDLLARLRRGVLRTPALRHRREDILPLLRHYWLSAFGCELPPLAPALVNALLLSDFRENVRGLQSIAIDLHATAMRQGLQNRLELHAVRERLSEQRRGIEERGNPISAHKRSDLASPARTECGDIRNPSDLRRFAEQYMALGTAYAVGKHFGWDDNKVARWKKECQRHGLLPKASL